MILTHMHKTQNEKEIGGCDSKHKGMGLLMELEDKR